MNDSKNSSNDNGNNDGLSSYVVVFPTIFSKKRIAPMISNIKRVLTTHGQRFGAVRRDGDVILVDANDPVFASSAINTLFGIEKIAIARRINNDFDGVVAEIIKVGGNLLLKGEKFLVRVEGTTTGFHTNDIEMAATSGIIEKKAKQMDISPGTEHKYNKLLYTYLTERSAYVCIFIDVGRGGIPFRRQHAGGGTVSAIYDEISAISCLEAVKQGYDIKIIVCYRSRSDLVCLAKMISQIIPSLARRNTELEFYHLKAGLGGFKNYMIFVNMVTEIMLQHTDHRDVDSVVLALSPLIFAKDFIKSVSRRVFECGKVPVMPLAGLDAGLFADAKEIGFGEKGYKRLHKIITRMATDAGVGASSSYKELCAVPADVKDALSTRECITIKTGPNNVHDILDSLQIEEE